MLASRLQSHIVTGACVEPQVVVTGAVRRSDQRFAVQPCKITFSELDRSNRIGARQTLPGDQLGLLAIGKRHDAFEHDRTLVRAPDFADEPPR